MSMCYIRLIFPWRNECRNTSNYDPILSRWNNVTGINYTDSVFSRVGVNTLLLRFDPFNGVR